MINDSVREELRGKISPVVKTASNAPKEKFPMPNETKQAVKVVEPPKPILKAEISEINSPPTPTLVEFHSKNAAIPEWRLQLQNTVRKRQDRSATENGKAAFPPIQKTKLVMSGATALKAQPIEKTEEIEIASVKNPTLSSALERIKNSRQKFLREEEQLKINATISETAKPVKNFPFHIAGKTSDAAPNTAANASANVAVKPALTIPAKIETKDLETNKLPAPPKPAPIATNFEKRAVAFEEETRTVESKDFEEKIEVTEKTKFEAAPAKIESTAKVEPEAIETEDAAAEEEIDDCAPFAMRFNAGLFDLIIGSFASLLLLSPFMLTGGESWLTVAGAAAFLATCALVMFIYLTAAIGKYGKTFGMHLFSLEVIDIEDEQYPTLHQAAVSSALYLISLAFGGLGFVTMFFNEEKRAVHDLVSGTIVVKEF